MNSIQVLGEVRAKLSNLKGSFIDGKPGADFYTQEALEKTAQACGILELALLDEINYCIAERKKRSSAVQPHNKRR